MDDEDRLSELIKRRVNRHGELHLDRELTRVLIEWIQHKEKFERETLERFDQLRAELDRWNEGEK